MHSKKSGEEGFGMLRVQPTLLAGSPAEGISSMTASSLLGIILIEFRVHYVTNVRDSLII